MASNFGPDLCRTCSSAYSVLNTRKTCPRCKEEGCVRCVKFTVPGVNVRMCSSCASSASSVEDVALPSAPSRGGTDFTLEPPITSFPAPARSLFSSGPLDPPPSAQKKPSSRPPNIFDDLPSSLPALSPPYSPPFSSPPRSGDADGDENPFSFFKSVKKPHPSASDPVVGARRTIDLTSSSASSASTTTSATPSASLGRSPPVKPIPIKAPSSSFKAPPPAFEDDEDDDDEDDDLHLNPSSNGHHMPSVALPSPSAPRRRKPAPQPLPSPSSVLPPFTASGRRQQRQQQQARPEVEEDDEFSDEDTPAVQQHGTDDALVALAGKVTQLQTALAASSEKLKRAEEAHAREKRLAKELQEELAAVRKKEADDTKAMEKMLQAVEQNLVSSQKRALAAEKSLQESEAKYHQLAQAHSKCGSGDPADAAKLESVQQLTVYLSDRLSLLHTDFASAMKIMLAHANDFKELSDITKSLGNTSEISDLPKKDQ